MTAPFERVHWYGNEYRTYPDMTWPWETVIEDWGADFDYDASAPSCGTELYSTAPIPEGSVNPIFKSRVSIERFRKLHCPPFGADIVVGRTWEKIILDFVPRDRIQFYPV